MQVDFGGGLGSLFTWPNTTPDTKKPFDLNLFEWQSSWDVVTSRFQSDQITRPSQPDGANSGGFSDPRIDSLIDQIETTYDADMRTVLFREYQELIAQEQPVLFAYYRIRLVAAANGLTGVDGPLDLNQPLWDSRPERIVLRGATAP